jgi:hypothetical protein
MNQCSVPARPFSYLNELDEELLLEVVYNDGDCRCGAVAILYESGDIHFADQCEAEEPEPEWLQWCRQFLEDRTRMRHVVESDISRAS